MKRRVSENSYRDFCFGANIANKEKIEGLLHEDGYSLKITNNFVITN